jgi:hypothetical protein
MPKFKLHKRERDLLSTREVFSLFLLQVDAALIGRVGRLVRTELRMHTCPPPIAALQAWLKDTARNGGSYGHLLLEQRSTPDASLVAALRPYFESAHQDAREVFHADAAIDVSAFGSITRRLLDEPARLKCSRISAMTV